MTRSIPRHPAFRSWAEIRVEQDQRHRAQTLGPATIAYQQHLEAERVIRNRVDDYTIDAAARPTQDDLRDFEQATMQAYLRLAEEAGR